VTTDRLHRAAERKQLAQLVVPVSPVAALVDALLDGLLDGSQTSLRA